MLQRLIRLSCVAGLAAAGLRAQAPADSTGLGAPVWVTAEVKAPRIERHFFESAAAKARVSYHVYLPAAYARETGRRFPVIYWLHGSGGGQGGIPKLAARFDAAMAAGKMPPCLIVFVNGLEMGMYVDWADGSRPMETQIIRELLPHVDATWRTVARREGRLIEGFSMGGYGAGRLGFKFPETFAAVSMLASGPLQPRLDKTPRASRVQAEEMLRDAFGGSQARFLEASPRHWAETNAKALAAGTRIRVAIGSRDETYGNNLSFHRHLETLGVPHAWTVIPELGHDPEGMLEALGEANWTFYREVFGETAKASALEESPRPAKGEIRLVVGGTERRALFSHAPEKGVRPAVIILHGGMGSAEQMRVTSGFEELARAEGFAAVYPEGTEFSGEMHAWNTGHLLRRRVRGADDIAFLDALIDRLVAQHGADPARIFMTGSSNGGMMTFVYAATRPRRLAAAAPVVASMFRSEPMPEAPVPMLIINGGRDDEVPIGGGMSNNALVRGAQSTPYLPLEEVVAFWVTANRCVEPPKVSVVGTVTTRAYMGGADGAPVEFVVDAEGGHGWPGRPSRRADNQPIQSFKGADRVWQFFRDKSRPAPSPGAAR